MKHILFVISVISSVISGGIANAADLDGHVLSCNVDLRSTRGGSQTTDYHFIKGQDGTDWSNLVVVVGSGSMGFVRQITTYSVKGNLVTIHPYFDSSSDQRVIEFDLSQTNPIVRKFKSCVFPGQGGGDARSICAEVVELCSLH